MKLAQITWMALALIFAQPASAVSTQRANRLKARANQVMVIGKVDSFDKQTVTLNLGRNAYFRFSRSFFNPKYDMRPGSMVGLEMDAEAVKAARVRMPASISASGAKR